MEQAKDRNGKTEQEFLRDYDVTKYFRPSVTVDAVLYRKIPNGVKLLMVKRGGHPYIGHYAFPGGFVDRDEDCETAAARELEEETHIKGVMLKQLITASTPDRDPRWRNITVIFCAELSSEIPAHADDDAADAVWFDITNTGNGMLEFKSERDKFCVKLDIVRDAFGKVDINKTRITERGLSSFDHAKIVYFLIEDVLNSGL